MFMSPYYQVYEFGKHFKMHAAFVRSSKLYSFEPVLMDHQNIEVYLLGWPMEFDRVTLEQVMQSNILDVAYPVNTNRTSTLFEEDRFDDYIGVITYFAEVV